MLQKMNQTGVWYKPGTMAEEEVNIFGEISEFRFQNKYPHKEFPYDEIHTPDGPKGSANYDFHSQGGDSFKLTTGHLSSYKGGKDDPINVPEQSERNEASSRKTEEIA